MSTELLEYCLTKLLLGPRELSITQLIDPNTKAVMDKLFVHHRFKEQQNSILTSSPDHPLYGRGYLWPYELQWTATDNELWSLRIVRVPGRAPTAREAILLASVAEHSVPFPGTRGIFRAVKARLLGKENNRTTGAVYVQLRPAVANVQFLCQDGTNYVTAVNPADVVDVFF